MTPGLVGVSLKAHLGWGETLRWLGELSDRLARPAADMFVCPPYPLLASAVHHLRDADVEVGSQDVSRFGPGAHTGDVPAAMLTELGVRYAELGHAERRKEHGETDADVAAKAGVCRAAGLTPVVCVGEARPMPPADAASFSRAQLRRRLASLPAGVPVVVAYEPEWAIGAARPADPEGVCEVIGALREVLDERARILYGGSASEGVFSALRDAAAATEEVPDGLFIGRAALDVRRLRAIVDEVGAVHVR